MKRFLLLLSISPSLYANPQNPTVMNGQVEVSQGPKTCQVTASDRAVIHWDAFSIAQGETTRFILPSQQAAVLNRVTGIDESLIQGMLQSNGHVYLVNPNGIHIGKMGRVDAGCFVASTMEIPDAAFLEGGDLSIRGDSLAAITHLGTIETSCGPVVLLAHKIDQQGTINAPHSTVSLTAGHEILLSPSGQCLLYIRPDLKAEGLDQQGVIEALEVQLQCDGPSSMAMNLQGCIEAKSVVHDGGKIFLRATEGDISIGGKLKASEGLVTIDTPGALLQDGLIDVSGEKGGRIELRSGRFAQSGTLLATGESMGGSIDIQAKQIAISQGELDASGLSGSGGTILIGGRSVDKSFAPVVADTCLIAEGVAIRADGYQGDGGSIIVWSDQETHFHGSISGKALGAFGDGGEVEISSKENLLVTGLSDLSSRFGKTGTVLFDPGSITINHSGSSGGVNNNLFGDSFISTQLATASVTLNTANSTDGLSETITIDDNVVISWSTSNLLTLIAGQNIVFNETAGINYPTFTNTYSGTAANVLTIENSGIAGNYVGIALNGTFNMISGGITMNGVGGQTGSNCIGIAVQPAKAFFNFTGNGDLNLTGTGGGDGAGSGNYGIYSLEMAGESPLNITMGTGALTINGYGGSTATGDNNGGIYFNTAVIDSTNVSGGPISLTGVGGALGGSNNIGVYGGISFNFMVGGDIYGDVSFNGTGGGNGVSADGNYGVYLNTILTCTADASISVTGTTLSTADASNVGVYMDYPTRLLTQNGTITVNGTGNGMSIQNYGVYSTARSFFHSQMIASGTGSVFVTGQSSGGTDSNLGVYLESYTNVGVASGQIVITGTGGGSGTNDCGIFLGNTITISSSGSGSVGAIELIGTGSSAATASSGICYNTVTVDLTTFTSNALQITSADANISVTGNNASPDSIDNYGILLGNQAGTIQSTGSGVISLSTSGCDALLGNPTSNPMGTGSMVLEAATGGVTANIGRDLLIQAGSNFGDDVTIETAVEGSSVPITLIANRNISITSLGSGNPSINNQSTGNLILVVDNSYPSFTPPYFGPGAFTMDATGVLVTSSGKLQVYTSEPGQNSVLGTLNGVTFSSGSLQQVYDTYYPGGAYIGPNYTIYYKPTSAPPSPPPPASPPPPVKAAQAVAVTQAVSGPPPSQVTAVLNSSQVLGTSVPDPTATCRVPRVSVEVQ
jgi:filamentous hemagglutinin family protein